MGCNQVTLTPSVRTVVAIIPCTVDDIAKTINDIRKNPRKYADGLEKELSKFTDEYSVAIEDDVLYRTNEGKEAWKEAIEFLKNI